MFLFVNPQGQTFVTRTNLYLHSSFSLPELDGQLEALVISTTLTPKPAVSVQGTLGGVNLINVFGEDPLEIQITGVVVGANCDALNASSSALGVGVDIFAQLGIVNRATPLRFRITGQPSRKAFMVALTVMQDTAFADMARFNMMLLAENLQDRRIALQPTAVPPSVRSGPQGIINTGVVGAARAAIRPRNFAAAVSPVGLIGSGVVASPLTVPLVLDGFDNLEEGFDV